MSLLVVGHGHRQRLGTSDALLQVAANPVGTKAESRLCARAQWHRLQVASVIVDPAAGHAGYARDVARADQNLWQLRCSVEPSRQPLEDTSRELVGQLVKQITVLQERPERRGSRPAGMRALSLSLSLSPQGLPSTPSR
jgi:hypothetical protein